MTRYNNKRTKQRKRATPASEQDWQQLAEDATLRSAYTELVRALHLAQHAAEERSRATGTPVEQSLDLRGAERILGQYPQLANYLDSVREKAALRQEALGGLDLALSSPTGGSRSGNQGTLGGWAGTTTDRNNAVGVNNARRLRDWSEGDEWVNSALNFLSNKVARADIAVLPGDEQKPYNRGVLKGVQNILDQPNELRDTWPMLIGMFVRDLLTLGQGCLTKNNTLKGRIPVALYCEDAANIKIYPAWSGDPDEPRYLYQEPGFSGLGKKVPLRNDEAIVAFYNPTSYRFGMGPVQVLADTIVADLKATEAAIRMVDHKPPPTAIQLQGFSADQIKKLRSTYESEIAGRREILFFGGDKPMSVHPLIFSMKDQQFMEWQEYLAHKICACFGITLADLSFTGDVNRATAQSQQDISNDKGFIPLLLMIEEYLNRELLADFAPKKAGTWRASLDAMNLRVVFPEVSEASRMLHIEKAIALASSSLAGLPSATLNQILSVMGEPPVPNGGNTFWVNTASGPMPWLSYDGNYGDWQPTMTTAGDLGSQDAAGGVSADDTADDDMGQTNDDVSDTPASQAEAASTDTSGGSSNSEGQAA